ncbi:dTMP kinase [Brevibacterium litoralis]|uniref:dTMP kinase n=1 Tax=Brevibacterium litoralis TaxID=3138935 RepID=UPI0032EE0C70
MTRHATTPSASTGPGSFGFGPLALEFSAWLVALAAAASAFGIAGYTGVAQVLSPGELRDIAAANEAGEFSLRHASLSLLVCFVLAGIGMFVPVAVFADSSAALKRKVLAGSGLAGAMAAGVLFFVPLVWVAWVVFLCLGMLVMVLLVLVPGALRKPWRAGGAAAGVLLFFTYAFQIGTGVGGGAVGVRWTLLVGAALLLVSGVLVLLGRDVEDAEDVMTASFPKARTKVLRDPSPIDRPWACYVLFGLLGAVIALAQPTVADLGFGQAGFAVLLCTALGGWALGHVLGPTFAPGMSRPRVTAFALLVAGGITVALGVIDELSGKAVLTGGVACLVGLGVRAQPYVLSRRVGIVSGGVLALLFTLVDRGFVVPLSAYTSWLLTPTGLAYLVIGLGALAAGVAAHLWFVPQGLQGVTVDVVHGFRGPRRHGEEAGGASGSASGSAARSGDATSGTAGTGTPSSGALASRVGPRRTTTGLFIAVEGGDGSGKSTQIRALVDHLKAVGLDTPVVTREPGGTPAGNQIRRVLLDGDGVGPRSEALLFAADRAQHVSELVDPELERGSVVVTDRYIDSSLAYQAAGRELSEAEVAELSQWATSGLVPHLTLVLDIDPDLATTRRAGRAEQNHLDAEGLEFHRAVRKAYLDLADRDPERYVVIDAGRTVEEVAADVRDAVDAALAGALVRRAGDTASVRLPRTPGPRGDAQGTGDGPTDAVAREIPLVPRADLSPEDVDRASATDTVRVSEDAATTVLPPVRERGPRGDTGDGAADVTTDDDPAGSAQTDPGPKKAGPEDTGTPVDEDAPTRVLPATPPRDGSGEPRGASGAGGRERLARQAEIERQARERLRQSRLRRSGRERPEDGL